MDKPVFIMMCGLVASGKSYKAKELAKDYDATIFSSDDLREELFGDANNQEHNQEVFVELHRRIKECLRGDKSAIMDSTNISYKHRLAFLQELKNIPCEKICVLMATPYEECLKRNAERERKVPEDVIKRMYMSINIPYWYEGWDKINVIGPQSPFYNVDYEICKLVEYDQGNSHHTLSLGDHLWKAYFYYLNKNLVFKDDINSMATILHDIGKPFCRSELNTRGINDGNIHYYNHNFTSAYDSLFVNCLRDRLEIAIRIMWHMQPYFWERDNNEKLHNKYRKLWGEDLYQDIMKIHEADKAAK